MLSRRGTWSTESSSIGWSKNKGRGADIAKWIIEIADVINNDGEQNINITAGFFPTEAEVAIKQAIPSFNPQSFAVGISILEKAGLFEATANTKVNGEPYRGPKIQGGGN